MHKQENSIFDLWPWPWGPWCLPSSFCSREYMGWKKLFEKFQEGCLLQDHLWYFSGIKEAFLSFLLAWPIQISFCSWGHMVWKKMLFDAFQHDYLVDGHLSYLNGIIKAILGPHLPWRLPSILCSKENMDWRCCLKNSKMAVKCIAIFDI